ncbi:MAG: succinylglutamate desuccinylase/aspartoacylase family protein [Pyrinomonadaceae bacterium]
MKILGQEIIAGKRNHLEMDVASLYTRTSIKVPIIIEKAAKNGPTLLLMGGIHGDEVNGIEIIRRLLYLKLIKPERGTVICIPVANVMAFLNMNRKFADGRDLNRSFPGNRRGSLASQVAYSITKDVVSQADYVVDLHTGAAERFNYPQIRHDKAHPASLELATVFNAPFTLLQDKAPSGSIRRVLNNKGTPSIVFEGGKSRTIDEQVVGTGVNGVLNVLDHLNIRQAKDRPAKSSKTIFLSKSQWVRARNSGMFQPLVDNGSFVKKGQLLAYVNGPYAQFQRQIKSPIDGHIFCVNQASVVYSGDAIFHIGQE